ncbi:coatomer subunit gamma [Nematocida ausubeli]|nr:coatomer subunit gamma [Nematocida ausubeli]
MRIDRQSKEKAISEMSAFTERVIITRKCTSALVNVLKEIGRSEFTELEIDAVISRLLHSFHNKDLYLKTISYAFIRSVADLSSGAFVAINALINNIAKKDSLRAEALKLLLQITPEQMLEDCSKYVQQSLIETEYDTLNMIVPVLLFLSNPSLAEWFSGCGWLQGLKTTGPLGNAVVFINRIRPQDSREVINILKNVSAKGITSVQIIRYLSKHLENPTAAKIFVQYLSLDETDPSSFIEAMRHIHMLPSAVSLLDRCVKGLKKLLQSNRVLVKIAALRTVDMMCVQYKQKLLPLTEIIEGMLTDNGTIALLAMGILLKIGSEKTANKIAKSLPTLLSELGEVQKISIIESVTGMCDRFKGTSWDELFKKALNASGSCNYKVKIIHNISKVQKLTEDKELKRSLEQILSSYIEDSVHPRVTVEILGSLVETKTSDHMVSLLNRTILDGENVQPAVNLSLAVADKSNPMHILFSEGCSTEVLKEKSELTQMVIDKLEGDAEIFIKKREESQLESKFNSVQLQASNRIELNRSESEFGISVVKNIFPDFIVLQYRIASKIDLVLEEGRLRVFLENKCINEEMIYLRGRESTEIDIKIPIEDYKDLCGAEIASTFGYSVYDSRDYEVGEVRLNAFEISVTDFIAPGLDIPEEEIDTSPLVKEYRFGMGKDEVIKELKNIFKMEVAESDNTLEWGGIFMYTKEPVLVKAVVKEKGSAAKATIKVFCKSEEIKSLLIDLIH